MNLIYDGKAMNKHDRTMVRMKLSKATLDFNALYRIVRKLKEMTYSPILAVSHRPFPREHIDQLEEMVWVDDIYVMSAALMLGPRAHVLSNDAFRDHRHAFQSATPVADQKLFDVWKQSNFVNFAVYSTEVHNTSGRRQHIYEVQHPR
uniref:Uncharacterized protein n=1 Tax=Ditylenchus dipsaci TaxID=166011 RepID=A0A915DTP5_9BILA